MDWISIYPARVRVRSFHIESTGELIAIIVAIVLYLILNLLLQKLCPNLSQKLINIISLVPALAVMFILIFFVL